MHNIEIKKVNGVEVASFAENGRRERAWHGLGEGQQIFDRPMFVEEALKACHADYEVAMQPVVALSQELVDAMENGKFINASILRDLLVDKTMATIRTDTNKSLGIVSDKYGLVSNKSAFEFVDMFCSGKFADRDNTPVIETCGVLGNGERVFVTAKFPTPIVLDAKRNDLVEMYVVFTTSHDGTGAVRCMCTPIRVVCQNTLNMALNHNIGRIAFRHSSKVMSRLDLLNKENAEFAYNALNVADVYTKGLKESFDHLRSIKVTERDIDNIIAEVALADDAKKIFLETRNINHEDIATRGRNIFLGMKESLESGIGQDILDKGNALWAINGITTYYQNVANYKNQEVMFDNIMDGNVYKKVNKAYDMMLKVA
jgi:phage/plasmid-like protein (TIGR03299 family)